MKRILLNTALATVLYLSNTTYASDINQDDVSKNTLRTQTSLFSEEIYKNIFKYLPLESSGRFSQVSRDFKRLTNNRNKDLYPQFTHLLKSIRDGRLELKLTKNFPDTYVVGKNSNESDSFSPYKILSLQDDFRVVLGRRNHAISRIESYEGHDYNCVTYLNSLDCKIHVGVKRNNKVKSQVYIVTIDPKPQHKECNPKIYISTLNQESQHSDTTENTNGIQKAYMLDNEQKQFPVNVRSFQFLQHPEGIIQSFANGMSPDGQNIFGHFQDRDNKSWGFIWTPEKGMQKLTGIESKKSGVSSVTDGGEIIAGSSREFNTDVAGIWVGKERVFFPMQKLFELSPNPTLENVLLKNVFLMSPHCKSMIIEAVKDTEEDMWLSYVLPSDDDSSLSNDTATLSIN